MAPPLSLRKDPQRKLPPLVRGAQGLERCPISECSGAEPRQTPAPQQLRDAKPLPAVATARADGGAMGEDGFHAFEAHFFEDPQRAAPHAGTLAGTRQATRQGHVELTPKTAKVLRDPESQRPQGDLGTRPRHGTARDDVRGYLCGFKRRQRCGGQGPTHGPSTCVDFDATRDDARLAVPHARLLRQHQGRHPAASAARRAHSGVEGGGSGLQLTISHVREQRGRPSPRGSAWHAGAHGDEIRDRIEL
mmetsp:Transcript_118534/g.335312  ORF Transcript_118534/g.335312 Transcript_118534/m.335312 type:complete len:248 (-) Transcript_118534:1303-2046(-)